MLRIVITFLFAGSLAVGSPQGGHAQTYTCTTDTTVQNPDLFLNWRSVFHLATDPGDRAIQDRVTFLQLNSPADARNVNLVATKRTCNAAGAAVQAWLDGGPVAAPARVGLQAVTPPDRTMWVIRINRSRYVVRDMSLQQGEFDQLLVFDADWNFLKAFHW